jgi:hypothetical protein
MSDAFTNAFLSLHSEISDTNKDRGAEINENDNESPAISPGSPQDTPKNDGKLILTVLKYDSGTAKLLPGGRLAPTPSQLAASQLGLIRVHLLKDGYLEKAE